MTTAPTPAAAAAPPMAHIPDSQPEPPHRAEAATGAAPGVADSLAAGRIRLRDQIAVNPLLSLFGAVLAGILGFMGTVVIALLAYTLATANDRFAAIDDRFAAVDERFAAIDERFARLEDKVDAGFAAQDAKINEIDLKLTALIAAQDAKINEIDLKLTALIAALNLESEVGAALQGTLLEPGAAS
ncbi:MAG: hypothetical protein F4017_05190 [Acidimicrobiaceae bacterium]|nr:hypothetical protein [Acidimicrobiaceae bacterium]MYK73974.1 hypothetical protein [Acidimicrobiaceae bacterium]